LSLTLGIPPSKKFLYDTKENEEELISPFSDPFDNIEYRLPNTTRPLHYDIWITTGVHRDEREFHGKVKIQIEAINNTNEVVIHYRLTTIEKVDIFDILNNLIEENVSMSSKDDVEFLIIKPTQVLSSGQKYLIEITYRGSLRDDRVGFYRTTYIDTSGNSIQLASTKFEPHNARHAFPCYDEPWIRASYNISIRHGANYTAISNMPQISRSTDEKDLKYVTTKFAELHSVQSYLVAFMVSNLAHDGDNSSSVPQRVFAKKQSIENDEAELALNISGKILDGFSEYFHFDYALPKMDQVGFPDFVSGAMENWVRKFHYIY
jgi:aminopeptidase N